MTATLVASPSTPAPGAPFTLTITGGDPNARARVLLDGVVVGATICDPTTPMTRSLTAPSAAGTYPVAYEKYSGGTWVSDATSINIVVAVPPSGGGGTFPPDRAMGFLTPSLQAVPSRPAYLGSITDAYAGTEITRVTNVDEDRHLYSRCGPASWNKDGSRILMAFGSVSAHIIQTSDWSNLVTFAGGELVNMPVWDPTDANRLIGIHPSVANRLVYQNATTKALTTIKTFDGTGGFPTFTSISLGEYEGGVSDDGTKVALIGDGNRLVTVNISTVALIANIAAPAGISDCQISPSGAYVSVGCTAGKRSYPVALGSSILLNSNNNHADNAVNAAGEDILVTNNPSTGYLTSYRLSDGASTLLLGSVTHAVQNGHVGRARLLPGWIGCSVYDTVGMAGYRGNDQLWLVKTDGSGTIRHFGYANNRTNGSVYAAQPHATWSPDGTECLFASPWGSSTSLIYDFVSRIAP